MKLFNIYVKLIDLLMKKIRLFFTALMLLVAASAFAQNITVSGTVTDSSNVEAVPFASVHL